MTKLSLENYTRISRVTGLVLSPDGRRLVLTVDSLAPDSTRFISSLWEVAADGSDPPRRLTFSEEGESRPAFLPDGTLVFSSGCRDPTVKEDEAEGRIWLLPASGGEARPLLSLWGGGRGRAPAPSSRTASRYAGGTATWAPDGAGCCGSPVSPPPTAPRQRRLRRTRSTTSIPMHMTRTARSVWPQTA